MTTTAVRSDASRWRLRHLAVCAMLAAFAINSSAGRLVSETKVDLTVDPFAFLGRALHLWDPQGFSGQVQNQAYGYLFPIGPFFALGHAIGAPGWVVQRLWWAALLITAYTGVVALARRLRIGTPFSAAVAGIAYATSAHLLTVLGPVSAEALPMCLTPWVLAPLVTGSREGSTRRAAMLSGLAVALMGGANATLDLAALVPAVTFLLTRTGGPRRRRLIGWWVLAVVLATAWWVVPLLLLAKYSPPFLSYIEPASVTTLTTPLVETMRGTSDWVAYLGASGSGAGWLLLTASSIVLMTVVVTGLGLAGLAHPRMAERVWLVVTLLIGIVVIAAGHRAPVQGPFTAQVQSLLDGVGAPLRNVHKFDVAIRLPVALGIAHVIGLVRIRSGAIERRVGGALVVFVTACAVIGAAAPLVALRSGQGQSFRIPAYWTAAARWLGTHDGQQRTLLVPATHDESYLWGTPTDNPLQPLARAPWAERNSIPLAPIGGIRALDAITNRLESGTGSSGLAAYLAASGMRYLLVRNDLDPSHVDNTRPVLVRQALVDSPGLTEVASFGPVLRFASFSVVDQNLRRPTRALSVWRVDGAADLRTRAVPVSSVPSLTGGPESVLDLADQGVDATTSVLAGDVTDAFRPVRSIVTDGLRRRIVNFGAVTANASATLTAQDPVPADRPAYDYGLFDGNQDALARLIGVRDVVASSTRSDAVADAIPAEQPFAAVDGDPATFWQPAQFVAQAGQWLQIDFDTARDVSGATIRLAADSPTTVVDTVTDHGSERTVLRGTGIHTLAVRPGTTRSVRVILAEVGGSFGQRTGIAELAVPGIHPSRTIDVPRPTADPTTIAFHAAGTSRAGCVVSAGRPLCAVDLYRQDEDEAGLDRAFDTSARHSYAVAATIVPRPGAALDALLAEASHDSVEARASSQAVADPRAGPANVVDGSTGTGWVADATDPAPTLTLTFDAAHTFSRVRLVRDPLLAATMPQTVQVRVDGVTRAARISGSGVVTFSTVRTKQISFIFRAPLGLQLSDGPQPGALTRLGIGVSEVRVPGVPVTPRVRLDALPVHLPCGSLPDLDFDGTSLQVQADTSVGALRAGSPIQVSLCAASTVDLSAGTHRFVARSTAAFRVLSTRLRDGTPPSAAGVQTTVTRWSSTDRSVDVGLRATPTLLVVTENANAGWRASLHGRQLRHITVDGWEQGYLLPAGPAGTVTLIFEPDSTYRWGLAGGLLALLLLVVGAGLRPRRPCVAPAVVSRRSAMVPAVASLLALVAVAGLQGGIVAVVVAGGALAAARLHGRQWIGMAAAALPYLLAGSLLAADHWTSATYAADRSAVQILCVIALASTACAGLLAGRPSRRRAVGSPAAEAPSSEPRHSGR